MGLWAVAQHYDIIDTWLRSNNLPQGMNYSSYKWHCLTLDVPAQLKNGNDWVDGTGKYGKMLFKAAQAIENSHQHAMRKSESESPAAARQDMMGFVDGNVARAKQLADDARQFIGDGKPDDATDAMNAALTYLGMAQHPIADDTSPEHYDFQVWHGLGNPCALAQGLFHHLRENERQYERVTKNQAAYHGEPWRHVKNTFNDSLNEILKE